MHSDVQVLLSKLYTDATFRKDFIADKNNFYKKYGIASAEIIEYLNAIKTGQLEFFADGLRSKRFHEVKNLVPLSARIIGKNIHSLFSAYSETGTPTGIHKHHNDALDFISYLLRQQNLNLNAALRPFLNATLTYERQRILNFSTPKKYRLSIHPYNFAKQYLSLIQLPDLKIPAKKRTVIFWKNGKIRSVFGANPSRKR